MMPETSPQHTAGQICCAQDISPKSTTETTGSPANLFEVVESTMSAEITTEDEARYPKGARLYTISGALAIILVSLGLDVGIMAVTVPALSDHFHKIEDIGWYSTALTISMGSMMFLSGKAYTLFSVKTVFQLSLAIFQLGNVLCTFARSSLMFIVGRAVGGLGCAGLSSGVFTIFTYTFPMRQRALVGGIGGGLEMLSNVAAAPVGGALISNWTWRACFGINIPLGIFGCLFIHAFLHLPPNPGQVLPLKEKIKRLDLAGTAIFAPAVVCLLLALQWGSSVYPWHSVRVIILFILSGILFSGFLLTEWKSGEKASLPFRILKNRSLLAGGSFAFCCNGAVAVAEYYMSIYFQGVRGYTAFKTGLLALPMVAGMSIAAPLAGAFTTWTGYYFPTMYTTTILASVAIGILTTITVDTSLAFLLCMLALLGFAIGTGIQAPQVAAQLVLAVEEVSIGFAIIQFGSLMGPGLLLSTSAAIFTDRLSVEILASSPSTNITSIDNMGLTDIRKLLGGDMLGNVLAGYNEALVQTMYLPLSLTCASIVGCIAIERRSIKKIS
jgi:MFS family permease